MRMRTVIHTLMALAPFFFLLLLGIDARTSVDTYEPVGCTPESKAKYDAWIEPMRQFRKAQLSHADLTSVAIQWLKLFVEGKLPDLPSMGEWDNFSCGVKKEIHSARYDIWRAIVAQGRDDLRKQRFAAAADKYLVSLEFLEILKLSDLTIFSATTLQQKSSSIPLQKALAQCPPTKELRVRIGKLIDRQTDLSQLMALGCHQFDLFTESTELPQPHAQQIIIASLENENAFTINRERAFTPEAVQTVLSLRLAQHHRTTFLDILKAMAKSDRTL